MDDDEFLHALEACTLPKDDFRHHGHLRAMWCYLDRYGRDEGQARMAAAIRAYAAHVGSLDKYNETMTRFWVEMVDRHRRGEPTFTVFLAAHPRLQDKQLPWRHWHHETLFSDAARHGWVEPDRQPIPPPAGNVGTRTAS